MAKNIVSIILQAPLVILVIISFFGSIYAAMNKIAGIGYETPVIFGVIIALYFYGIYLKRKTKLHNY